MNRFAVIHQLTAGKYGIGHDREGEYGQGVFHLHYFPNVSMVLASGFAGTLILFDKISF